MHPKCCAIASLTYGHCDLTGSGGAGSWLSSMTNPHRVTAFISCSSQSSPLRVMFWRSPSKGKLPQPQALIQTRLLAAGKLGTVATGSRFFCRKWTMPLKALVTFAHRLASYQFHHLPGSLATLRIYHSLLKTAGIQ
jgi:hypothetical protein